MSYHSPDTQVILDALKADKEEVEKRLDHLTSEVKALRYGFPDGDPAGHRRYHESVIQWQETRNKLVKDALTQAAKAGFLAGIGWVVYAVFIAAKMEFMK